MDCDTLVIGSGAGGGAVASRLAEGGQRVIVIERGARVDDAALLRDEHRLLVERAHSDDRVASLNGRSERPVVGSILGGSTRLYGGVMLRPSREDFEPGRSYGARLPRALWHWPVDYDALAPWYAQAEALYAVAGTSVRGEPHLERPAGAYPRSSAPLDDFNARLSSRFARAGHALFRLPLAVVAGRCVRCSTCPGLGCPTGARASSASSLLTARPMSTGTVANVALRTRVEAERLVLRGRRVVAVRVRALDGDARDELRADSVVVSGGALATPALLLASRIVDASGQLGRNHMCPLGALAVGIGARPLDADGATLKQLGSTALYFGAPGARHKLGYAQFVPLPGAAALCHEARLPPQLNRECVHGAMEKLRQRALVYAGAVEDLPDPRNRVTLDTERRIVLRRRFGAYDVARGRGMARHLAGALRRATGMITLAHVAAGNATRLAHQVGTARFGHDPVSSVADANGRVHAYDNLYIADGSLLPTSLGVGPALTIAALGLRLADHLLGRH